MPLYKGRRINKILCLVFLALTLGVLAAAGGFAVAGRQAHCGALLTLAAITGGFALVYGLLWLVCGRREKQKERALNERTGRFAEPVDPGRASCREFAVPKAALTEAAFDRFLGVVRWSGVAVLAAFLVIMGVLIFTGALQSPLQPLHLALFCLAITAPGLLLQWGIYAKYERSVPARILLFPGKLVVDDTVFAAGEIREIRVSPDRIHNPDSPAVFREMQIRTDGRGACYRLDYRSGSAANGTPFWAEYGDFVAALLVWGAENGVKVEIAFME